MSLRDVAPMPRNETSTYAVADCSDAATDLQQFNSDSIPESSDVQEIPSNLNTDHRVFLRIWSNCPTTPQKRKKGHHF